VDYKPIPRGQLDYTNLIKDYTNLSQVDPSALFYWPTNLVDRPNIPKDYQADLQSEVILPDSDVKEFNPGLDPILQQVHKDTVKSREKIAAKHCKKYVIKEWVPRDIVTIKLLKGTRPGTDIRRTFVRIVSVPYPYTYEV
jgi:hypothetical protein